MLMFVVFIVVIFSSFIFFFSYVWNDGTLLTLTVLVLAIAVVFGALQSVGSPSTRLLLWHG